MDKQQKYWLGAGLLILILAFAFWSWRKPANNQLGDTSNNEPQTPVQTNNQNTSSNGQTIEGQLETSNNSKKGNLMLVTQNQTLYIFTSRDYSALIGKQVQVTYDGTSDNFRLGDIVAK